MPGLDRPRHRALALGRRPLDDQSTDVAAPEAQRGHAQSRTSQRSQFHRSALPAPEYYTDSLTPVARAASLWPPWPTRLRPRHRPARDRQQQVAQVPAPTCSRCGWPTWTSPRRRPWCAPCAARRARRSSATWPSTPSCPRSSSIALHKRYGWRVSPEAVVHLPGVIAGFNLALRALTPPGDGLLIQTPVYPPILRARRQPRPDAARRRARRAAATDATRSISTAFAAAISDRTRVFLLCNPHNPVGRVCRAAPSWRAWPRPACERDLWIIADEIHCDLAARRPPARADRLARAGDRAAHDHADGAEQDLQPARAQVRGRRSSPTPRCASGSWPRAADLVRARSTCSATPPRSPPTATATPGWTRCCATSRQPRLPGRRACGRQLPGVTMAPPEGDLPGLARLPRRARVPAATHTRSSWSGPRWRSTTARCSDRAAPGFVRLNFACPRALLTEGLERMRAALA